MMHGPYNVKSLKMLNLQGNKTQHTAFAPVSLPDKNTDTICVFGVSLVSPFKNHLNFRHYTYNVGNSKGSLNELRNKRERIGALRQNMTNRNLVGFA
jgi:hypothetical protein